jgi:hypothetical protein
VTAQALGGRVGGLLWWGGKDESHRRDPQLLHDLADGEGVLVDDEAKLTEFHE